MLRNGYPFRRVIDSRGAAWYTLMESKFVYRNSGGVKRTMIHNSDDPFALTVSTEVDMTGVVENNKIMRELHPERSVNKLVARGVPMTVYETSIHEQWDEKRWNRWLNDPDNAAFRVWEGWVS